VSVGDSAVAQIGPSVVRGAAAKVAKVGVGVGYLANTGGVEDAVGLLREELGVGRRDHGDDADGQAGPR
jgi:NADH dehydrogenase